MCAACAATYKCAGGWVSQRLIRGKIRGAIEAKALGRVEELAPFAEERPLKLENDAICISDSDSDSDVEIVE